MKNILLKSVFFGLISFIFIGFACSSVLSQTTEPKPELCVAGICLGDNGEKVKTILQNYSPRYDNELHQPKYYFYNNYGNQVMAITAHSKEQPYVIVGIEAFAVGESYQKTHYQMKELNSFITESGFFIGARPSFKSMMFAIPNVTKAKGIIKKKGLPAMDEKIKKVRTIRYQIDRVKELETQEAADTKKIDFGSYTAEYRFVKNKLRRFSIAVNTPVTGVASNN
ncbi:MAG TPA: hypothetical protein VGP58_02875 [Pyrinomonadaceae bacterium]|jgi:hypothetical protein|nr:hypothetical protein [Pyrinomonadaceae bacterium]